MTHLHTLLERELDALRARLGREDLHIIETGTIRAEAERYRADDGWSTLAFARDVKEYGGTLISIDLDTAAADRVLSAHGLRVHATLMRGHSIDVLAQLCRTGARFDVAFLDSDNDAQLILHEYLIAATMLDSPGLVLVDDVAPGNPAVVKGHAIMPWLDTMGVPYRIQHRTGDNLSTGVLIVEV